MVPSTLSVAAEGVTTTVATVDARSTVNVADPLTDPVVAVIVVNP